MTEPINLDPVDPIDPVDPVDPAIPAEPIEPTDPADPQKPFNAEQEQYIGSWLGRIVKKQIEESVLPHLQQSPTQVPTQEPDALNKFNEKLQEKIFSGDVMGALNMAQNVQKQADQTLSKQKTIETDRALTALSDQPFYKDTFGEAQKIAHDAVQAGYPPGPAAEYAYNKAKASFLERKLSGDNEGLNLSDGGKPPTRTKTPTLPPEFKRACKRDIAKRLFKNEKEYIEHLSPSIRAKYGI